MLDVSISGAPYTLNNLTRPIMDSKISVPQDLCPGECVKEYQISTDQCFKIRKLETESDESKILVVVMDPSDELYDYVKKNLKTGCFKSGDFIEYRSWHSENEKEACQWLSGNSKKRYLITDEWAVAGFEYDNVVLVTYSSQPKDTLTTVIQRARANLIVLKIDVPKRRLFKTLKNIWCSCYHLPDDTLTDEEDRYGHTFSHSLSGISLHSMGKQAAQGHETGRFPPTT